MCVCFSDRWHTTIFGETDRGGPKRKHAVRSSDVGHWHHREDGQDFWYSFTGRHRKSESQKPHTTRIVHVGNDESLFLQTAVVPVSSGYHFLLCVPSGNRPHRPPQCRPSLSFYCITCTIQHVARIQSRHPCYLDFNDAF